MVRCKHVDMETKNLAVKVSMDLWRAITIVATNGNKTLAEVVVPVLQREFGELTEVTAMSVKQPSVALKAKRLSEVVEGVKSVTNAISEAGKAPVVPHMSAYVSGVVTDEEVPEKRCFKCKSKVRVWTMTEKGPICPGCKSQMEVSIP